MLGWLQAVQIPLVQRAQVLLHLVGSQIVVSGFEVNPVGHASRHSKK